MSGRLAALVLVVSGFLMFHFFSQGSPDLPNYHPTPPQSPVAKDPADWFAEVKADAKAARIAASQGKSDVLAALARSAIAYREQISAWSRTPAASNVYSVCGDLVIALAKVAEQPSAALARYSRLEDACRDAIIPQVR